MIVICDPPRQIFAARPLWVLVSPLTKLEHNLGRRSRPLPVGRPKKQRPERREKRK